MDLRPSTYLKDKRRLRAASPLPKSWRLAVSTFHCRIALAGPGISTEDNNSPDQCPPMTFQVGTLQSSPVCPGRQHGIDTEGLSRLHLSMALTVHYAQAWSSYERCVENLGIGAVPGC